MRQQAQPGAQQNAAATAAAPGRGLFGGMGGMLGGLLAGSLIGSLLFGGAFTGGGMMDLLLLALVLYFGFKFFARRRAATVSGPEEQNPTPYTRNDAPAPGGSGWDALSSKPAQPSANFGNAAGAVEVPASAPRVPAGFDTEEFLNGAKAAYARLNAAWDRRDLDDVAQFATPGFMDELRRQAEEDPDPVPTDILLVDAALVEVRTEGEEQIASVYFSVLLREDPNASAPTDVREVWHFVRAADGSGPWRLDGIQQVEN